MTGPVAPGFDRVETLLAGPRGIVNVGLERFAEILESSGTAVVHVDWQPPAGGDPDLVRLLRAVEGEA